MNLVKIKEQPAKLGLPASRREWWDLGAGYEVCVHLGEQTCGFGVDFFTR